MVILINHQLAVLKQGTSFDFISENNFFTGADSYTLSISFPLKGCPQNIAVFGHLYRKDCDFNDTILDCEIHDRQFHRYGVVNIVELSDTEVKVQFLEGRSKINYRTSFDDIYINEIHMKSAWIVPEENEQAEFYMRSYDQQIADLSADIPKPYHGMVWLPWVNNTSGNVQNAMTHTTRTGEGNLLWVGGDPTLVGFPFLIEVIKAVLDEVHYTYDLSDIEASEYRNLIVCNALPVAWELQQINFALPHWTVTEFIEQLELFLNGQFHIDENRQHISFAFNKDLVASQDTVVIENVIDTHTVEVTEEEDTDNTYVGQRNIAYQDCDHQKWALWSCPWAMKQMNTVSWRSYSDMVNGLSGYLTNKGVYTHRYYKSLHYCREVATYYILYCYKIQGKRGEDEYMHYLRLEPVNMFSPYIYNKREDAEVTELRIVPCCIYDTDDWQGVLLYIECGTYGDDTEEDADQTQAANTLKAGEKDGKEEYLDKLYVGFWNGEWQTWYPKLPHPIVDAIELHGSTYRQYPFSLRLKGQYAITQRTTGINIDQSRKYTFQFLADSIPDVRSTFLIHGKKYLAEKITATFSAETGMSQLLKMDAYRVE